MRRGCARDLDAGSATGCITRSGDRPLARTGHRATAGPMLVGRAAGRTMGCGNCHAVVVDTRAAGRIQRQVGGDRIRARFVHVAGAVLAGLRARDRATARLQGECGAMRATDGAGDLASLDRLPYFELPREATMQGTLAVPQDGVRLEPSGPNGVTPGNAGSPRDPPHGFVTLRSLQALAAQRGSNVMPARARMVRHPRTGDRTGLMLRLHWRSRDARHRSAGNHHVGPMGAMVHCAPGGGATRDCRRRAGNAGRRL